MPGKQKNGFIPLCRRLTCSVAERGGEMDDDPQRAAAFMLVWQCINDSSWTAGPWAPRACRFLHALGWRSPRLRARMQCFFALADMKICS
jgi:hypothetical protein